MTKIKFPLFQNYQHALKFNLSKIELSENNNLRYKEALKNALSIVKFLFEKESEISCSFFFFTENRFDYDNTSTAELLDVVYKFNLDVNQYELSRKRLSSNSYQINLEFTSPIDISKISSIFRLIIGGELGINKGINCRFFLFDISKKIILNCYDDRGLDIISLDPDRLLPVAKEFNILTLDSKS